MFGSLALTKMDCNRIANYFILPVLLGLAYFDIAYYHRTTLVAHSGTSGGTSVAEVAAATAANLADNSNELDGIIINAKAKLVGDDDTGSSPFRNSGSSRSIVDTIELTLSNGLGLMTIVQLAANLFTGKLSKILL